MNKRLEAEAKALAELVKGTVVTVNYNGFARCGYYGDEIVGALVREIKRLEAVNVNVVG